MQEFTEKTGIIHINVPPRRQQAEPVERVNKTAKSMIIANIKPDHR